MRNIEMSYYNVYYYCNIIDNLLRLFTTSIDWATTGAQFLDTFLEGDIEDFSKYSALHSFCDYAVRTLMSEEDEKELDEIQMRYDEEEAIGLDKTARLKYAFQGDYGLNHRLWVDRLLANYGGNHQSFYNFVKDAEFTFISDVYMDFCFCNGDIDDAVLKLSRELFYVLFQNRDFLYRFNYYLSIKEKPRIQRCNIPSWVKRAVKYRDRGRCVCCGRDLSGVLDCEDQNSIHYDHIVSLSDGGINDVSNIQLMCRSCNLHKSSNSFTMQTYKDWYDFDKD